MNTLQLTRPDARTAGAAQGLALIFAAALPTMAIVSLVPNLPQLFAHFGATPHAAWLVPMIITLPSLCIALFSPLIGNLIDTWGRRPVMLASLALFTAVGVLPYAMEDLTWVLVTRFFVGIAEAGILAAQNALMGDYFAGARRQRWLGLLSVISPVVAATFVLAGGALGAIDWHAPFLLYLTGAPMLAWAAVSLHEPVRERAADAEDVAKPGPFPWSAARGVALVTIGVSILYFVQAVQLGRVFYEHGVASPAAIGLHVTIASAGVVLGGIVFTRLGGMRMPSRFALMFASLGIGYAGLGLAPTAGTALACALVAQFGNGLAIPVLIGWALDRFGAVHRGRGMGIWGACFFVGTFLSPPLLTALTDLTGSLLGAVAGVGACCLVLAGVVFALRGRQPGLAPIR
ncbi:MAG: MFS transporter [Massilia sp.]